MTYPYSKYLEELGVKPVINAENWSTASVGGSTCSKEVLDVINNVEKVYCNINSLMNACCTRIANLCKVKVAHITTGAAGGIFMCTIACLIGNDGKKMRQLYGLESKPLDFKDEIIVNKG